MKYLLQTCVLGSTLLLLGCGGETGPPLEEVEGIVKFGGAALEGATVSFIYDDGQVSTGVSGESGVFSLTTGGRIGAPLGSAKVTVTKISADSVEGMDTSSMDPNEMTAMMGKMADMKQKGSAEKELLPAKYSKADSSGLVADVQAGADNKSFLFDLQK